LRVIKKKKKTYGKLARLNFDDMEDGAAEVRYRAKRGQLFLRTLKYTR